MPDQATIQSLLAAVDRYFALMFDNDVSHFAEVFALTAQLHGLRDGQMRLLSAQDYRNVLASTASPKSKGATRLQEVLLVDFASPAQALVKCE